MSTNPDGRAIINGLCEGVERALTQQQRFPITGRVIWAPCRCGKTLLFTVYDLHACKEVAMACLAVSDIPLLENLGPAVHALVSDLKEKIPERL